MHGKPGTTFSNILERDDYDPCKNAVVLLSTFRELLHKWIVDVYLQAPHRGIKDTPAHRWRSGTCGLPPPLPPSAAALDIVLGMTVQRVVFHYGIELEGLKFNGPELGELRRRVGPTAKVELTFDPGDLGQIHVLDPQKDVYICVHVLEQTYAKGLSLWQNRVIRRYAQHQLHGRTDTAALAQAKAEIRALIDRDFNRKTNRTRKRHARFMEGQTPVNLPMLAADQPDLADPLGEEKANRLGVQSPSAQSAEASPPASPEIGPRLDTSAGRVGLFTDDEILPTFEAALDLPCSSIAPAPPRHGSSDTEAADE